tara:strand:- start:826 stop:1032 length:207 start_codon:yes stop_codon:yes gene_type:complete
MITNWLFWAVPEKYAMKYIVIMWVALMLIPSYIFGLYYTKLGIILNLVWYDLIFYGWVKAKQRAEGDE